MVGFGCIDRAQLELEIGLIGIVLRRELLLQLLYPPARFFRLIRRRLDSDPQIIALFDSARQVFERQVETHLVVIGEDVKSHFFPGLDPVGRELKIGGVPYQIVGVAEKQGSIFGFSADRFLVVPYESPAHRLVNRFKVIDAIIVKSENETAMTSDMETVREVMRARHKLRPAQRDDFTLETRDGRIYARVVVHSGQRTLEVRKEGFVSYTNEFRVTRNGKVDLTARFTPPAETFGSAQRRSLGCKY